MQEKAESFALYKQQLSIGLNVLVTLLTAAIVGYALGRHFIDVNNKAGVSDGFPSSESSERDPFEGQLS